MAVFLQIPALLLIFHDDNLFGSSLGLENSFYAGSVNIWHANSRIFAVVYQKHFIEDYFVPCFKGT